MQIFQPLFFRIILSLFFSLCFFACDKDKNTQEARVGIIDGPDAVLWEAAQKVAQKKYGLTIRLVSFSDYNIPNEALKSGDIDVNAFQHQPFLDAKIKANKSYNLIAVAKTFVYPIALYSKKIKNLTELKEGHQIAVPNDPSNEGRALLLLEKGGLITLRKNSGSYATVVDIEKNPKKLKFIELAAAQVPRALDDVAAAVINNDFSKPIGLVPNKDGILVEDKDSPYMNIIVAREDQKDTDKIKKIISSYQSPEVKEAAKKLYGDSAIAGW